jgi:hypothetical protein
MTNLMIASTILISLALVFYSIGVWSERLAGRLKAWHLIFFWGGLVFDTTGTGIMMDMAGGLTFDLHPANILPQARRTVKWAGVSGCVHDFRADFRSLRNFGSLHGLRFRTDPAFRDYLVGNPRKNLLKTRKKCGILGVIKPAATDGA